MTATHRIRLYAVVLAVLVGLYVIGAILAPRRGRSLGPVFPGLEETAVVRVEISSGTAAVIMARQEDSWVIDEGDRQYPARADRLESLLNASAESRLVRMITGNVSLWADFGVADEAGTRLTLQSGISGGAEQVMSILWGGRAAEPGLSYLRLAEAPEVYASDGELQFYLQQPVSYWSYLRVLPEDVGLLDVIALSSSVDLELGEDGRLAVSYTLEREVADPSADNPGGDDLWVSTNPAGGSSPVQQLDGAAVARLLREVVDLVGRDFSRDAGSVQLPVVGSIEMVLSDGRGYSVEIFRSSDGFICRGTGPSLPGDPFGGLVYELTAAKVRRLFPALADLAVQ